MSRFIQVGKKMVDMKGLYGVWVGPDHTSMSRITLYYLDRRHSEIIEYKYGEFAQVEKDAKLLNESLEQFKKKVPETNT